jgi:hypothetical protein
MGPGSFTPSTTGDRSSVGHRPAIAAWRAATARPRARSLTAELSLDWPVRHVRVHHNPLHPGLLRGDSSRHHNLFGPG